MSPSIPPPLRRDIEVIIALDAQPILRNLQITQCYHDLSAAVASVIGAENLNWCTFATWASKTAGRFVRGEPLAMFRDSLQSEPLLAEKLDRINTLLRRFDAAAGLSRLAIVEAVEAPVDAVSRHIAAGNLAVFAELGPLFSLLCSRLDQLKNNPASFLPALLDELALKSGPSDKGGQDLLKSAVSRYYQAKLEHQADRKAELILVATAQTGLHEQMRLQPAITGALELPFDAALERLFEKQLGGRDAGIARRRLRDLAWNSAQPLVAEFNRDLNRLWRECVTRLFMTLRLPDGEIHLGKDLRPLPGRPLFPAALQAIEDNELRALLARYHVDGSNAAESGAADWADLMERMRFILTLFRARQQDLRLFSQPFADAQRNAIAQGRMPQGPL